MNYRLRNIVNIDYLIHRNCRRGKLGKNLEDSYFHLLCNKYMFISQFMYNQYILLYPPEFPEGVRGSGGGGQLSILCSVVYIAQFKCSSF